MTSGVWKKVYNLLGELQGAGSKEDCLLLFFENSRKLLKHDSAVYFPFDPIRLAPALAGHVSDNPEVGGFYSDYANYYWKLEPVWSTNLPLIPNEPWKYSDFTTLRKIKESQFYSDFNKRAGIGHVMGCTLNLGEHPVGGIGMHKLSGQADFSVMEKDVFRLIAPHLASILFRHDLQEKLQENQRSETPSEHAATGFEKPAIWVFDQNLRKVSQNRSAKQFEEDNRIHGIDVFPVSVVAMLDRFAQYCKRFGNGEIIDEPLVETIIFPFHERLAHFYVTLLTSTQGGKTLVELILLQENKNEYIAIRIGKLGLSKREKDVCVLLLRGIDNKEIADRLCISVNTVKKHVGSILRKAGCANRNIFTGYLLS